MNQKKTMMNIKTYSSLSMLNTFEDRFEYLKLGGGVANETFGHNRYVNQQFYASVQWKNVRRHVILRDNCCDLGILDRSIYDQPLVHHINVMTIDDILNGESWILDPEFLITTTKNTHNLIHYGGDISSLTLNGERYPNDTKLW